MNKLLFALLLVPAVLLPAQAASADDPVSTDAVSTEPVAADPAVTDASLTWAMNGEIQGRPFFGGSNFLSAGVSDGTAATYRASDGDVAIVQRTVDGTPSTPTWETRAAYVDAGGAAAQLVSLTGGDVTIPAGGGLDIRWTGAWSVNMYGGLAPFTLAQPRLEIAPDGTGSLLADLSGYAGVIGSSAPATPVAPVAAVTIATFRGVVVDTTNGFTVTPDFAGVRVTPPTGATPQDTTASGWGAWPQGFVDFHGTTGLASYWYTSGTASTDALKAPAAFAVGFAGVAPAVPVPTVAPVATTPSPTPTPTTTKRPSADTKPTTKGRLSWGVKSSFRSYVTGRIAKGAIAVSGGASATGGGFVFPQAAEGTFSASKKKGTADYAGAVRFTGHDGILDITLSDPRVTVLSASKARLSVAEGGRRIVIGTVDLASARHGSHKGAVTYTGAPVTLTGAGSAIFSYGGSTFYPEGTAMDAVTFTIGAPDSATAKSRTVSAYTTWTAPATPPTTTGATVTGDVSAGARVTVHATGFAARETGIHAVLYSAPVVLADDLTADASGTVDAEVTLPAELTGEHTITLQGSVDRGAVVTVAPALDATGCTVDGASITWGVKESFRSYISGTIAKGSWTTSGNASYVTPSFRWAKGGGTYDADTDAASVAFAGGIRFTGHDGALDLRISDPVLRVLDARTAELLVDIRSKARDGGATVVQRAVRFVTLDLSAASVETRDGALTITGAPATLTSEGARGFAGFYESGAAFDPLDATIPARCAVTAVPSATPAPAASSAPTPKPVAASNTTALVVIVIVVLLVALALVLILRRRSRRG